MMVVIHRLVRAGIRAALRPMPLTISAHLCRLCPRLIYHLPAKRCTVAKNYCGRFQVLIDTTYFIERCLLGNCFEPGLLAGFKAFIAPGDIVIDIGANVGAATIPAAHAVGERGRVIAFEPGPFALRLRQNLALNPQLEARVQVVDQGLSDAPGFMLWTEDEANPGNASLGLTGTHQVPVTTLDRFLTTYVSTTTRISFLKIDVEGMEYQVLTGAMDTLRSHLPVIAYETWRLNSSEAFTQITDLLSPLGYHFIQIDARGRRRQATVSDHAEMTFAIPPGRTAHRL